MTMLLAFVQGGMFRRLLVTVLSASVVLFARRWGLELSAEQLAGVVVLAVTYVIQSAARQGRGGGLPPGEGPSPFLSSGGRPRGEVK